MCRPPNLADMLSLVLLCLLTQAAAADSLEGVRQETSEARPTVPSKSHRHNHCDDDESDFLSELLGPPLLFAFTSPWWLPASAIGDEYKYDADFLAYPYQFDREGYLSIGLDNPPDFDGAGLWFSSEYGTDFGGLHRAGQRLRIDTSTRFGLDAEFNSWFEDVSGGTDTLFTGDANLVYRFAQSEQVQWHSGLGLNWLGEDHQSEFGFNFTYGVTMTPAKPYVFETTFDIGTLGSASLFHVHSSAGLIWKQLEIFTGYDYLRIGHQDLHGPVFGCRLWF